MSMLRTNTLQTVDSAYTIDIEDLAGIPAEVGTKVSIADLANNVDVAKGSNLVGLAGFAGTDLYEFNKNTYHVSRWGVFGTDMVTAPVDEWLGIQAAVSYVASVNGTLLFDNRNYLVSQPIVVTGAFRSFKLQGVGTGNSQTASTGGTTILTSGGYRALRVEFNTFANENFRLEGLNFYNLALNVADFEAVSVVRGAANSRYISGFLFKDVGIKGYGAGFAWQGMNTTDSGLNYFGTTILDHVSISDTGVGFLVQNASLNLLDLRSVLLHTCPQGGIRLARDGAVGVGNGRGSSVTAHISGKSHFEEVGGMFRTQTVRTFGGTGTSAVLRSTIHMDGLLHEFCGSTIGPTAGDPFALGVDTDIIVTGDVNYGLGFGEVVFPTIGAGNTISSSSPIRVNMAGGRSLSPKMVNAPIMLRTVPNTQSTVFAITTPDTTNFAVRSKIILQGGAFGVVEGMHNGTPSGTKHHTVVTPPVPAAGASGVTVTYAPGAAADVINCTVLNNSTQTLTVELQVENISSCTILNTSEI